MLPARAAKAGSVPRAAASEAICSISERLLLETQSRRAERDAERQLERTALETGTNWWELDCPSNMMNVHTVAQLQSTVDAAATTSNLVVVNLFAPECYACRSMQPKLRALARQHHDVMFVKVNGGGSEELRQYAEYVGVTRIPYFHLYMHGKRVAEFTANMRPEKLALLRQQLELHKAAPQPARWLTHQA